MTINLSFCLSVGLSLFLFVYLPAYLSVNPCSIHLYVTGKELPKDVLGEGEDEEEQSKHDSEDQDPDEADVCITFTCACVCALCRLFVSERDSGNKSQRILMCV
jgi:hypothetical protein